MVRCTIGVNRSFREFDVTGPFDAQWQQIFVAVFATTPGAAG